jgi:hypothetical protein
LWTTQYNDWRRNTAATLLTELQTLKKIDQHRVSLIRGNLLRQKGEKITKTN